MDDGATNEDAQNNNNEESLGNEDLTTVLLGDTISHTFLSKNAKCEIFVNFIIVVIVIFWSLFLLRIMISV
jgi:hypothetical protein